VSAAIKSAVKSAKILRFFDLEFHIVKLFLPKR
jgi:hypothetical protein